MKVETIELPDGLLSNEFYICSIQLKSPFWDEVDKMGKGPYNDYIGWKSEPLKARNNKIKTLLSALDEVTKKTGIKINVLVFPEYTIEKNMLNLLDDFSQKHKTIVVAGYYDDDERQSVADIIVPYPDEIRHYKQYKLYASIYDKQFLSNIEDDNRKYYRFVWQPQESKTGQNFIHIFVCLDFLKYAVDVVDTTMAGLIICPMCTPKIKSFYGLSEYFMRAAEGYNSIVTSLCNSTDTSIQQNGIKACGESQIIGPYGEKELPVLDYFLEGGIIARVKLNSALTIPTRIHSDEVISGMNKFFIESDGKVKELSVQTQKAAIAINPNVIIKGLGLRRIYVFYNARDYYDFRKYVQNIYLPMQCHGIFGVYDILFQGYEEDWNFFELRLMSYIGPKYDYNLKSPDKRPPEHYEITDVWKYRGKELITFSEEEGICYAFKHKECHPGYLESNLKNIRNIYLGKDIDPNIKKEFEKKCIVFGVDRDSDITYEEKRIGLEEYLVFLFLYPSGSKDTATVMREFQESVLPALMKDNRIKTIEFSSEQGHGNIYPKGTYILHLVGKLDDLRKIILDYIHRPLYEKKIICGTRVVPTAESLSNEEYLSLNETILNDPTLRYTIHDIIYYLKYSNRFIIKQLPIVVIERVATLYTMYKVYVKNTLPSQIQINVLDQLDQFIYGFCEAFFIQDNLNEEIFETIRGRCAGTYNSTCIQVEKTLNKARENAIAMINNLDDDIKKDYHTKLKNEKVFIDTKQTVMGILVTDIHKWNTKIAREEHRILNNSFTEAIGKLHSVAIYRNYFSHAFKDIGDLKNKNTNDFANELLENIIKAFNFISMYAQEIEKLSTNVELKR